MVRAGVYCRVSRERQEEEGTSLDTQLASCRRFAAERGWSVVAVEQEVYSAGTLDRPKLRRLRELAAAGGFDVLLAHKQERISREQSDTGVLHKELADRGIKIWTVLEGEFDQTPIGKFMVSARSFAAEVDRAQRREAGMRGQKARIASGKMLGGHPPLYGYRFVDELDHRGRKARARYEPNPDTAPVVRRMYREYLAGKSLRQIALTLSAEGIPTPRGGARWSISTVTDVLSHPGYKGEAVGWVWRVDATGKGRRWDTTDAIALPEGTIPPLVTPAEWERVQLARKQHKAVNVGMTKEPHKALLRGGIARCGMCGRAMRINRLRDGTYLYLCNAASETVRTCKPTSSIKADTLDAAAWAAVSEILHRPELIRAEVERLRADDPTEGEVAAIEKELAAVNRKRRNLLVSLEDIEDKADRADAKSRLDALAGQRRALEERRAGVQERQTLWRNAEGRLTSVEEWCRREATRIDTMGPEERRQKMEQLGLSILVYQRYSPLRYLITADIPGGDDFLVAWDSDVSTAYGRPGRSHLPAGSPGAQGGSRCMPLPVAQLESRSCSG